MTGAAHPHRLAGDAWGLRTGQDRLGDLAARLSRALALARGLVAGGRCVDLTGVDDGIGVLCAQTLDLPAAEGRGMLPHLHEVLSQLDLLSVAIHGAGRRGEPPC